jgi:cystathionine gamma-synthase
MELNGGVRPESRAAHGGGATDHLTGGIVPPVHPATTFERAEDGTHPLGYEYTRADNPSFEAAEALLADLEGADHTMLFGSGMAAATSVFCALVPGDHVVVPRVFYWALRKWIAEFALTWGIEVTAADTTDLEAVAAAIRPGDTRIVWLETPANPTWQITDIGAVSDLAHAAHARVVVDSTVATPVHTRPIEHGADLVVHSATKALNGHSDVLAGAVVAATDDPFTQRIRAWRRGAGALPGSFEAWLLLRGMRTLFPRARQGAATAQRVAEHLATDPRVGDVLYPGLVDHPGHDIAVRQMHDGFGAMLSIRVAAGEQAARVTCGRLDVFRRATSLGGTESLVEHRSSVEGPSTPVPSDLLRLSIGLEHPDDLIADLDQALDHGIADEPVTVPPQDEMATRRRTVIARGGDLVVDGDSVTAVGSPGAVAPLRAELGLAAIGATTVDDLLAEAVAGPIAAHGGTVDVVHDGTTGPDRDGVVSLRLGGRCQGCAMAQVTMRQGIEPLLRDNVAGVTAVVDLTDHAAGTDPYHPTAKR